VHTLEYDTGIGVSREYGNRHIGPGMNSDTRHCQGASNGGLKTQQSDCHSISAFIFLHRTGRLLGCLPFIGWSSLLFHCENSM
jgi:hypothetical protein